MKRLFFVLAIATILLSSCNNNETSNVNNDTDNVNNDTIADEELINTTMLDVRDYEFKEGEVTVLADSIMYTAMIKNPKPVEDAYMNEWLANVDIKNFAGAIFNAVYKEKLIAYDYITGDTMTIEAVKELEAKFNRDRIAKVLFTEEWYFDENKLQMYKKVNSIMLAYERIDDDNNIMGYKSGIRVYLNGTKPMKAAVDY
ncbi:MAG: hypothetical protein GY756_10330 [bacterium]|nr:hypothetical protein [bacterium]